MTMINKLKRQFSILVFDSSDVTFKSETWTRKKTLHQRIYSTDIV